MAINNVHDPLPHYPVLYQINTRVWLTELSHALRRRPRWMTFQMPTWTTWPRWVLTGSGS